jgi:hypothetical protein
MAAPTGTAPALSTPTPRHADAICVERPGCWRMVDGAIAGTGPTHCPAPVAWAGTVTFNFPTGQLVD